MNHFAFVLHPLDLGLVGVTFKEPSLLLKKYSLVKKAFEWLPSFKCAEVSNVRSSTGVELKGTLLYCPLLPEQILSLKESFVVERVISAGKIAQESGADILGLGAYTAHVGKKGIEVKKALNIPVTTGTHYTIHIAAESILSAANRVGIEIGKSNVAIIGAAGGIGRVCAEIFFDKAARITLVARNQAKIERLVEEWSKRSKAELIIMDDLNAAMKDADISIMATTSPNALIDVDELKPGSLVCDVSRPRNVSKKRSDFRKDVLVIDGGIVQPPGDDVDFNLYFGLPKGLTYACMAETMILALEEKYESYSIGGSIKFDKVKEIGKLGDKHGFKLAKIRSFDTEVPDYIFDNIRKLHSKK
ncbi:MAG: shikimate dehydrogenase [Candidatus Omnitrophota bacterium]|jgi:predicted amino acid dehydrogenase